jgi:hypothetical protein
MMRLMSDLLPALIAAHDGVLKSFDFALACGQRDMRGNGSEGLSGRTAPGRRDQGARGSEQ